MSSSLRVRATLSAVFASTALVVFAAPALAAPPANDDLADAAPVGPTLPATAEGTTVDATAQAGEPSPAFLAAPFNSVWYSLDVPAAGDYADIVTVSTCPGDGGNGDYIDVYAVNGPGFGGLARQERFGGLDRVCEFTFVTTQGTSYRIVVDRANDGGAPHELSVSEYTPPAGPANDDLADAQEIGPELPIEGVTGTNVNATPEIGEPSHGRTGQAYQSVWYLLDVPEEGDYPDIVTVNTCSDSGGGNNYVGVYAVAGPGFAGLVEQAPAAVEQDCAFTFAVTEGTDYRIAVDNLSDGEEFELTVAALDPPPNDGFADREQIPSQLPQQVTGTTTDASAEEDEPEHGDRGPERSVWYEWTSGAGGAVKIDVCEIESDPADEPSSFSPEIAAYVSENDDPAFFDLSRIAGNGRNGGCTLVFNPRNAGETVYIAIDGIGREENFVLELAAADPPPNDDFADRQVIPNTLPQTIPGTTFDATTEAGEPDHGEDGARRTVWYEFTSEDGLTPFKIDVCDSGWAEEEDDHDVVIAAYVGDDGAPAVDQLGSVAANNGNDCTMLVEPGSGDPTTFYIAIDSGEYEGDFNMNLRVPSPPANDDFADAIVVGPGLPVSIGGTNVDATGEQDEPYHGGDEHSVWYAWTPDATQTVIVHTCAISSFRSAVAVYTGTSFDDLDRVNADAVGCPGGIGGQKITFEATEGTPHLIAVDGDREGAFTLGIQLEGTPPGMPTVTGVSPASGSNDNDPRVTGTADAGSTVLIYPDADCYHDPVGSGTAAEFASAGIPVEVEDDTTTTFYAAAANVDGRSDCSATSVTYAEVSTPPDDSQPPPAASAEPPKLTCPKGKVAKKGKCVKKKKPKKNKNKKKKKKKK